LVFGIMSLGLGLGLETQSLGLGLEDLSLGLGLEHLSLDNNCVIAQETHMVIAIFG